MRGLREHACLHKNVQDKNVAEEGSMRASVSIETAVLVWVIVRRVVLVEAYGTT